MAAPLPTDFALPPREAALRFLAHRINYERSQTMPYDPARLGLERMQRLLDRLGNPERGLAVVHVAGTKGKGSTSAMIGSVLSAAGYRTGLFTSPHLDRIEERMAVDGQACSGEELVELVELVRPAVEALDREQPGNSGPGGPTYFEITTAMALLHFARCHADAVVLEVGLGGRLDATNVCTPLISVITSISFDHTELLGDTLAAIAGEKAGIVKPGVPVVSGVEAAEAAEVIRRICRERGCRLIERGSDFDFDYQPPRHLERAAACGQLIFKTASSQRRFPLGLIGRHQAANAAVAVAVLDELRTAAPQFSSLTDEAICRGLSDLHWPARVEVIARRPTMVLDTAHNGASVEALVASLGESFSARRRLLVFATTHGKDLRAMLGQLLGAFDEILFTRYTSNPRGVPPEELAALAEELTGRRWPIYPKPADALDAARRLASPDDLICITGSFFLAAEIRDRLGSAVRSTEELVESPSRTITS